MSTISQWNTVGGLAVAGLSLILGGCARMDSAAPNNSGQLSVSNVQSSHPKDEIHLSPAAQVQGGVEDVVVKVSDTPSRVTATGTLSVNDDRTWHVSSYMLGSATEVDAKVGDMVRSGEVLARMHSHEVHDTRAAYQQSIAALRGAQTQESVAKEALTRAQNLFRLQAISSGQVDQASADLARATAMVQL
jgi:cobalt-zinc-cadmium efflux system membrane fusion protein